MTRQLGLSTALILLILLSGIWGKVMAAPEQAQMGLDFPTPVADCHSGAYITQADLNDCSHKVYLIVDRDLNLLYKKVQSSQDVKSRQRFQAAQLAWIKFRDLQCAYAKSRYEGGSIAPLIYAQCLTDLTQLRNRYLRQMLKDMPH